ncbi:restriction endonuclease subunit S [Arthrobacter sp. SAFR-044]|uniref:restriction endonuclease subunit S n=1 Tax=Arthrobacter sp. SAFR-044 TaxID=3387278 RepID=UPI003F7C0875
MSSVSIGELVAAGVLQVGDGYRTKRAEHAHQGYRIIRVADVLEDAVTFTGPDFVSENYARAIGTKAGKPGDILLTTKGTVGRVAVLPDTKEQVVYSPQLCFFRVLNAEVVDPRFLRYWFSSAEFWRQAGDRMNNTDMAAYINLADIRSLKLTVPDIPEQRSIAEVLGALDNKIAGNTKLAAAANELAVALVSTFEPSVPLGEIAIHKRKSVSPNTLEVPKVAHYSLPAYDAGQLPEVASPFDIKSSKFLIERPSVLISKLNPRFPRVWNVAEVPEVPALSSTEFLVLESSITTTTVLWALLRQEAFGFELESKVAGTSGSHQRVRPADLLATHIADPRLMGNELTDKVTSLGKSGLHFRLQNETLTATRDALLPHLMSGKLRVKDAEKVLENAVV